MECVVTGGAGFIGRHLCYALLGRGDSVVCIDNFQTSRREALYPLENHKEFTLVEADVRGPWQCGTADVIFNLACPASPPQYQIDPLDTLSICIDGMRRVLDVSRKSGAKVIQASTSEVYGTAEVFPQSEDYWGNVNPIGVRACYDEGKRVAETMCFDTMRAVPGADIRVIRIFNTYGPGMLFNDGRVVSNFMYQGLTGKRLTVYGVGEQTRSFCYVDDLIRGLLLVESSPGWDGKPINLGNPDERTVADIRWEIQEAIGRPLEVEFLPMPEDDPRARKPDISRAQAVLGWGPQMPLQEGLLRMKDDFEVRIGSGETP